MRGHAILLVALLLLATPAQADPEPEGEPPQEPQGDGTQNETAEPANEGTEPTAGSSMERTSCDVVRYHGVARPTYVVVDPDRCYLPGPVRELVHRIL